MCFSFIYVGIKLRRIFSGFSWFTRMFILSGLYIFSLLKGIRRAAALWKRAGRVYTPHWKKYIYERKHEVNSKPNRTILYVLFISGRNQLGRDSASFSCFANPILYHQWWLSIYCQHTHARYKWLRISEKLLAQNWCLSLQMSRWKYGIILRFQHNYGICTHYDYSYIRFLFIYIYLPMHRLTTHYTQGEYLCWMQTFALLFWQHYTCLILNFNAITMLLWSQTKKFFLLARDV